MLFAVDVGNTQTTAALFDQEKIVESWRFITLRQETADGLAARLYSLFAVKGRSLDQIDGLALASVVPTQQASWKELTRFYLWTFFDLNATSATDAGSGIMVDLDRPEEVGADRIANAVAAAALYTLPAIIVDFGTATTFDCVAPPGRYLGGAILPGLAVSLDALSQRAAKLPRVDLSAPPPAVVGGNTVDAIKSGLLHGAGALVDGMKQRIAREQGWDQPAVILTGGLAHLVAPFIETTTMVDQDLTLHGLRIMYQARLETENR